MTPAQRMAEGCTWSRAVLQRHRRYAVVTAANENPKPVGGAIAAGYLSAERPEPTEWR